MEHKMRDEPLTTSFNRYFAQNNKKTDEYQKELKIKGALELYGLSYSIAQTLTEDVEELLKIELTKRSVETFTKQEIIELIQNQDWDVMQNTIDAQKLIECIENYKKGE
jgi:uncharacterized protein YaaW (UPF0174 family)